MQVHYKEKKYAKFRFSFVLLFIIASFSICFVFYMKNDDAVLPTSGGEAEASDGGGTADEPRTEKKNVINPVPKSEKAENSYFDSALILAYEQMNGLSEYAGVPKDNLLTGSFTPSDIVTAGLAASAEEKEFDNLYIFFGSDSALASDFSELSDFISKIRKKDVNMPIYLVSVLPITAENETDGLTNSEIDEFNSILLGFADENGVNYIDINTYLVGNDGKLPDSKQEIGGNKLKKETCLEIEDFLLTHIAANVK